MCFKKNKKTKYIFYFLVATLALSCSRYPSGVEQALELAGDHRAELEKVLEHYGKRPEDKLKRKAAYFLIRNMPFHFYYEDETAHLFFAFADSVFLSEDVPPRISSEVFMKHAWSLFEKNNPNPSQSMEKNDIKNIPASLLVSHIDNAFDAWKTYPWGKKLSFRDFCEYVLPYRANNEPPEEWRTLYRDKLAPLVDSLIATGETDEKNISEFLSAHLVDPDFPYLLFKLDLPASVALNVKIGGCKELTSLTLFALRSFAIPVAQDLIPQWGNRSKGHSWNLLLSKDPPLPFSFGDTVAAGRHLEIRSFSKMTKVYRQMFSVQKESLAMQNVDENIPSFFKNPFLKDVSSDYFEPVDIRVNLTEKPPVKRKIVYIMAFNNKTWAPVHWARNKNGKATFTNMAKNCAYMVMYYHNHAFLPAASPFYVDEEGQIKILTPHTEQKRTVCLTRKFHDYKVREWVKELPGGKFQVADNIDFVQAKDLYTIDSIPEANYHTILLDNVEKYKYFRYIAADHSTGNMAEIELFDDQGRKLTGEIIGTNDTLAYKNVNDLPHSEKVKSLVFDGEVLTYFKTKTPQNIWVGLVLKEKEAIRKIRYLPRNDDNFIREKEEYELFYWDKKWYSLGKKEGSEATQQLIYDNVPDNALLLLRNLTKGHEERIFTYENGKQVWW